MTKIIQPTEWQARVLEVPLDVNLALFGGRGVGRTTAALLNLIRVSEQFPESTHLYVRNNLRSLVEVQDNLQSMLTAAYGTKALRINRQEHHFRLPNESTISFA